jgi:hypothetical protein
LGAVSLECVLMLGYALLLAAIALLLESLADHAHHRSVRISTTGFTYHPDKDVWRCPKDQHLFPVLSDSVRGSVIYRAPAKACNACPSKAACTDSSNGREIERSELTMVESGMKRFHRAVSLTLLTLASFILLVELFRPGSLNARLALTFVLVLFCVIIRRRAMNLFENREAETRHASLETIALQDRPEAHSECSLNPSS